MRRIQKHRTIWQIAYLCLCLIFFAATVFGAKQLSLTSDEPPHFIHGYLFLKTGKPWALTAHRHPPLSNMLSAIPLLLQPEQPDPILISGWGEDFVIFVKAIWPLMGPLNRLAYVTRYPNMLVSLLLLTLVIRWAREVALPPGAVFAALLLVLDPTLSAHSQLNTTDVSLAFFALLSMYLVWKTSPKSTARDYVTIGLALGCALGVKASGLLVVVAVFIGLVWRLLCFNGSVRTNLKNLHPKLLLNSLLVLALVALCTAICLAAIYSIPSLFNAQNNLLLNLYTHIKMVSLTLKERYRTAFLAGEIRQQGWWWYFPFAFAVKTPIPTILLTIVSALLALFHPRKLLKMTLLWLFPVIYALSSIRSNMNIGYRHLIPIFPFVYIGTAKVLQKLTRHPPALLPFLRSHTQSSVTRIIYLICLLLATWQTWDIARTYPFQLAYFNAFAGGPENGYHYLVDSNVDWGQSFIALKKYMESEKIPWVWLSYYTWIDPAAYGIQYKPLPPAAEADSLPQRFNPAPGVYALSATPLQGIMVAEPSMYDWFRHREPDAQPGYGLLVYRVQPPATPLDWVAQCNKPATPLQVADINTGFGVENLRLVTFDCENAWIYPGEGYQPGWYILHKELLAKEEDFISRNLRSSMLSYQQSTPTRLPVFAIYAYQGDALPEVNSTRITFGAQRLTLTGYVVDECNSETDDIDIITRWSINEVPTRSLSLMLHVIQDQTGETIVGDGLGVPISVWQTGDVLYQRHRLTLPKNHAGTYTVVAGVYWLDNLERWQPDSSANVTDNTVILTQFDLE